MIFTFHIYQIPCKINIFNQNFTENKLFILFSPRELRLLLCRECACHSCFHKNNFWADLKPKIISDLSCYFSNTLNYNWLFLTEIEKKIKDYFSSFILLIFLRNTISFSAQQLFLFFSYLRRSPQASPAEICRAVRRSNIFQNLNTQRQC